MRKRRLILLWLVLLALLPLSITQAQSDLTSIIAEIVLSESVSQSGIVVTRQGHILTGLSDELLNLANADANVTIRLYAEGGSVLLQTFEGRFALEPSDTLTLIEIISSSDSDLESELNLNHYNPIVRGTDARYLQSVSALTYSDIGGRKIIITESRVNTIRLSGAQEYLPGRYYGTRITIDRTGLGGLLATENGDFLGLITSLDVTEQFAEATPVEAICLENPAICQIILHSNRPEPENRNRPSPGVIQLTNGIGRTDGGRISDGQVQMDYYCTRLGMDIRINDSQEYWECVDPLDPAYAFILEPMHHDIICQQTYDNDDATAFQMSIAGQTPAFSWRCYG